MGVDGGAVEGSVFVKGTVIVQALFVSKQSFPPSLHQHQHAILSIFP